MMLHAAVSSLALAVVLTAASSPARALDCRKAASLVEKEICGDKSLLAQDTQLNKAFAALRARKSPDEARLLTRAQGEWIASRETECREAIGERPALIPGCVGGGMEVRRRFLSGEPETGAGATSPLWPVFRAAKGAEGVNVSYAFTPPRAPAEGAFNTAIEALLGKRLDAPKELYTLRYVYGSPRFVSIHAEGSFEGSAHPMPWRGDVNFDLEKGRVLKFTDVFNPGVLQGLIADCKKEVGESMETTDKALKADREKKLARVVADLGRWSFSAVHAVVGFDHGEINDYVEGDLECRFPVKRINEATKPDFQKF
jgi:uncharacterized protein YecT (DUF1311 family)